MSLFRRPSFADVALLLVVVIWGLTFPMIKDATKDGRVLSFVALRFAIATLAFVPFVVRAHRRGVAWRAHLWPGLLGGCGLMPGYLLQTYGLGHTSATVGGFLTGTSVVMVPLGAAAVLGQRIARSELAGLALVIIGLALLSGLVDPSGIEAITFGRGEWLVLGCAVAFSLQILVTARHAPRLDPVCFTAIQVAVVLVGSVLALALLHDAGFPEPELAGLARPSVLGAAVFTGLLATTLAFWVQTEAQRFTSAVRVVLIFSLEPVFAALAGWIWHGDRLQALQWVGAGMMLAGSLVAGIGPLLTAPGQAPAAGSG